jgi:hypothetical protein
MKIENLLMAVVSNAAVEVEIGITFLLKACDVGRAVNISL